MPSYTFVSTANAFVLRGAKIIFADCEKERPNIDAAKLEELITEKTKAIVVVHYAGMACDMDKIMELAEKNNLLVVEDCAQAIESKYRERYLGTFGHFAAFSFHETKNIIAGEGGLLAVNDEQFIERAEIIREKGTNRSAFFRGETDKYNWVDIGSSFLPSEIISAFLFAQLEKIDVIQQKRIALWNEYYRMLEPLAKKKLIELPDVPSYATNNGHIFYILCKDETERSKLITFLKKNEVLSVFHYLPLHSSPFYSEKHNGKELENTKAFSERLLRLPLFYELSAEEQEFIVSKVNEFYA
jgi:dTDP-4-amino-4,6-dideoxygalactose transaminase